MAASSVVFVNEALGVIGVDEIVTLADTSKAAKVANRHYDNSRRASLRAHPWNFAQSRVTLIALTNQAGTVGPVFDGAEGFTNYFLMPDGSATYTTSQGGTAPYCLRVLETSLDDLEEPWRVEGRYIITVESTLSILQVGDITDTTQWDALYERAAMYELATRLAFPLTGNTALVREMQGMYAATLKEARSIDGQERGITKFRSNDLKNVRL